MISEEQSLPEQTGNMMLLLLIEYQSCSLAEIITFTYLADAFIQSDLQLHSGYTFSLVHVFPGNRTHNLLRS